ncbi:MAG TPA: hypothetical protein VF941_19275 [Clostridia bacterium]
MKRDLKINFYILEEMVSEIKKYRTALDEMESASSNIVRIMENSISLPIDELKKIYNGFKKDIVNCREELQDLETLLSGYINEMQAIIRPVNKRLIMRVDRNDIWFNKQSIIGACQSIRMLPMNRGNVGFGSSFGFGKKDEAKAREEENYRRLENIWSSVIPKYSRRLDAQIDALNTLYDRKIIPYENKDDDYKSKANRLHSKYTSFWEWIWQHIKGDAQSLVGLIKGVVVGLYDTVKGLIELAWGIISYAASAVVLAVTYPFNARPKWAQDIFNRTNDTVCAILEDPSLIVEGLAQQISDTYEEEGASYCTGYLIGSLVGAKGLDKLGKLAKLKVVGKGAETLNAADKTALISEYGEEAVNAIKNGIDIDLIKKLDELGIKTADYEKLGIGSRETAEAVAEAVSKYGEGTLEAIKNGIDLDLVKKLDELGIKPQDYEKLGIVSRETAESAIEGKGVLKSKYFKEAFLDKDDFNKFLRENVWSDETLSNAEKIKITRENFEKLTPEQKVDFNVVGDEKFLSSKSNYTDWGNWPDVNWPEFPGLDKTKPIHAITKGNSIPESIDRIGSLTGNNFGIIPESGVPCTMDERAICYIENPSAYHSYSFDSTHYFDCIDCIKNKDIDGLNKIIDEINLSNGDNKILHVDADDLVDWNLQYKKFQNNKLLRDMCDVKGLDSTYGLMGNAAPWYDESMSKILASGGAGQINTPVSGNVLKQLGILKER